MRGVIFDLYREIRNRWKGSFQNRVLSKSVLFDKSYYLSQLKKSGTTISERNAVAHYIQEGDKMRISPHVLFDTFQYHHYYRDLSNSNMTALFHFIIHGYKEFRSPHPLFDMRYVFQQMKNKDRNPLEEYLTSLPGTYNPHPEIDEHYIVEQLNDQKIKFQNALCTFLMTDDVTINPSRDFDMHAYAAQNPDTRNYNAAYHYAIAGKNEKRLVHKVSSSINGIEAQINIAAGIDIDIIPPNTDVVTLDRVLSIDNARDSASLIRTLKNSTRYREVSKIFFVPHFQVGGAEKVLVNVINALLSSKDNEKILVIATDNESESAINWMPRSKNLFFCNISTYISHMSRSHLLCIIGIYIQLSRCRDIYVINSYVGWEFIEHHGKAMRGLTKCHAFLFCYDYDEYGRRAGYAWTHLSHCIKNIDYIFRDNRITPHILTKDLRLSKEDGEKFVVLYQPIDISDNLIRYIAPTNREDRKFKKKNILWASRFHRQKNLPFALEIAALMPEYDFTFAGGFADDQHVKDINITENVNFVGPYNGFESLLTADISLFIYTSNWDGLPNVLLEVGSIGIPIVARNVGGISDLVDDETGWLVNANADALTFSTCVKSALSSSSELSRKAANMKSRVENRHGWSNFIAEVEGYFCPMPERK